MAANQSVRQFFVLAFCVAMSTICARRIAGFQVFRSGLKGGIFSVAVSDDGSRFAIGSWSDIRVFDSKTKEQIARIESGGAVRHLSFFPDDQNKLCCLRDWKYQDRKSNEENPYRQHVDSWNVKEDAFEDLSLIRGRTKLWKLKLTPDSGYWVGLKYVHDPKLKGQILRYDLCMWTDQGTRKKLGKDFQNVFDFCFSPDGKQIVLTKFSPEEKSSFIQVHELRSMKLLKKTKVENALAFHVDCDFKTGTVVASGPEQPAGIHSRYWILRPNSEEVISERFNPDEKSTLGHLNMGPKGERFLVSYQRFERQLNGSMRITTRMQVRRVKDGKLIWEQSVPIADSNLLIDQHSGTIMCGVYPPGMDGSQILQTRSFKDGKVIDEFDPTKPK